MNLSRMITVASQLFPINQIRRFLHMYLPHLNERAAFKWQITHNLILAAIECFAPDHINL